MSKRRLLLIWALLLGGIVCLAQQTPTKAYWQSRDSNYNISVSSGAACAGFSIDGAATSQPATGASTSTQSMTIGSSNEIIFSIITVNAGAVASTSDNSGVTSGWTSPRASSTSGNKVWESWTTASAPFTGATITTSYAPGVNGFTESIVFGVIGGHVAAPFDTGGASNVPQTGAASPLSININATNSLALGFFRNGGNAGPQATWTQIAASAGFTLAQFKPFTLQQTALSVSDPSGSANGSIADALICGP